MVQSTIVCVDRRRQWANARNLRHNAGITSALYALATPVRLVTNPGSLVGICSVRPLIPRCSRRWNRFNPR
jgi:hypothetical protein